MERSYPMHCLFRSNVGDVKMMPFKSNITNIMRILGAQNRLQKIEDQSHLN